MAGARDDAEDIKETMKQVAEMKKWRVGLAAGKRAGAPGRH